ncbi:MAG: DUF5320 domain-containing protein [Candidatus Bathyarchaeia archaeon]
MCRCCCCCIMEGHHHHHEHKHMHHAGFPWPIMDVEEEIKMLEEYKEALAKRLEKVNKRLEVLKR